MRLLTTTIIAALPFLVASTLPNDTPNLKNAMKIPLTKRYNLVDNDGVVDIPALNAHVAKTVAKIDRGFANYEKNTGTVHPSAKGLQKRDSRFGDIALMDSNHQVWQGFIVVGTPHHISTVEFDTGSSDTFLPGPDCDLSCYGHTVYNPNASITSKDLGKTFRLYYIDGSTVTGEQYTDMIQIAGLTVIEQTIGVANRYSYGLNQFQFPVDGMVGMGFGMASHYSAPSIFETLVAQQQVASQVFSFKLTKDYGSELSIGHIDPSLYTGNFSYAPIITPGFWQVKMDISGDDGLSDSSNFTFSGIQTIVATGTHLIIGDPSNIKYLYDAVGGKDASSTLGAGYYTFPCSQVPRVNITFDGRSFPIPSTSLSLGPTSPGSLDCIGAIVAASGLPTWVLGTPFLSNVYSVFDYGNSRVGFATLA